MALNMLAALRGDKLQQEMADKYGVTQQTWSSWENGKTTPSGEIMLRMERDFSVPMENIFFTYFHNVAF